MIKVSLSPPPPPDSEALEQGRAILLKARAIASQQASRTRSRAKRYACYVRRRGFDQGYREGLARAAESVERLAFEVRAQYSALCDLARKDAQELALQACEEVIDASLSQFPALLVPWLDQALDLMKRSRTLVVEFHPRYAEALRAWPGPLPAHVVMREGKPSQLHDFSISGELGGVHFSWREALKQRFHSCPEGSSP